jgi:hypothetical protein
MEQFLHLPVRQRQRALLQNGREQFAVHGWCERAFRPEPPRTPEVGGGLPSLQRRARCVEALQSALFRPHRRKRVAGFFHDAKTIRQDVCGHLRRGGAFE